MSDVMYLWKETAPYSEFSPEQAQPSLTPFPVSGSKGAVVVIPGGAYCMKADHEGAPIARMLNDAGISAYVLDYRVRPCHKLAPLADANRAIRLVRSLGYEKVSPRAETCAATPRRITTWEIRTATIPSSAVPRVRTGLFPAMPWSA